MNRLLMICYLALMMLSFFLARIDKASSRSSAYIKENIPAEIRIATAKINDDPDTTSVADLNSSIFLGNFQMWFK